MTSPTWSTIEISTGLGRQSCLALAADRQGARRQGKAHADHHAAAVATSARQLTQRSQKWI